MLIRISYWLLFGHVNIGGWRVANGLSTFQGRVREWHCPSGLLKFYRCWWSCFPSNWIILGHLIWLYSCKILAITPPKRNYIPQRFCLFEGLTKKNHLLHAWIIALSLPSIGGLAWWLMVTLLETTSRHFWVDDFPTRLVGYVSFPSLEDNWSSSIEVCLLLSFCFVFLLTFWAIG